jgi:predicted ATP-dependent endonuclease of OLD family
MSHPIDPARPEPPLGRAVVLVEGTSDQLALEALAERQGRSLGAEGIAIVPIGGAQAISSFLARFGPRGLDLELAGMCDVAEEDDFRRGLERAGLGSNLTRAELERLGFYVCAADLEDELVRALGTGRVEELIESEGELDSFRTFQKQLQKRSLSHEEQLHGFMWNRKIRYAPLLVGALELAKVPRPLERVLAHV